MNPHRLAIITQNLIEKSYKYDCICGWTITANSASAAKRNHEYHAMGMQNEGTLWDSDPIIMAAMSNLHDAGLI